MNADGQVYADVLQRVAAEDRKRLEQAEAEDYEQRVRTAFARFEGEMARLLTPEARECLERAEERLLLGGL